MFVCCKAHESVVDNLCYEGISTNTYSLLVTISKLAQFQYIFIDCDLRNPNPINPYKNLYRYRVSHRRQAEMCRSVTPMF